MLEKLRSCVSPPCIQAGGGKAAYDPGQKQQTGAPLTSPQPQSSRSMSHPQRVPIESCLAIVLMGGRRRYSTAECQWLGQRRGNKAKLPKRVPCLTRCPPEARNTLPPGRFLVSRSSYSWTVHVVVEKEEGG